MPIYDYVCANGHRIEVIHSVTAEGPTTCPVCGLPLRKAITAPAVHFKGSGWAKKERSSTATAASAKAAGEPVADATPSSTGGDAKPAPKDSGSTTSAGSETSTASTTTPVAGSGSTAGPPSPAKGA